MNRLGRAYETIVFGSAMLGLAAIAACSGEAFSVGANGSTIEPIDTSAAGTAGPSCDSGWSHSNVCCDPTGASCEVFKTPSLQVCPADHPVTRPDGRFCCPQDGASQCAPSSGSPASVGTDLSCTYACLPGYSLISSLTDPPTNQCCHAGGSDCYTVANPDCSEPVCNCPAQTTTGSNSCTCSPAPACPLPSPPSCNACPSGWQVPAIDPALCCRNDPSMPSVTDCFSQAIPLPPPSDAGTGPAPCIDNGVSHADGTSWTCSDGCNTCTCNNGQATSTLLACVADAAPPPPAKDAGPTPCVDNGVSHANGTSWTCSNDACGGCFCENGTIGHASTIACPVLDGGSGSGDAAAPPPSVDAGECSVASDCKGALPALCEVCTNGGDGCAHFTCNAGVCAIAYCE
ncbi:MAG TPA: hypothetical protein VK841_06585 [Polyangiaceae bacterium]|jgi:hypothetical protein|nr:hypothetical protein [Polyangiaceae bacterium]